MAVGPKAPPGRRVHPARRAVYVWEAPVRVTHWAIAICILVLSVTGYYIHNPFLTRSGGVWLANTEFVMGWMRFLHELFAFVFIAAVMLRLYWAFAGNRYASWRAVLPLTEQQRTGLREIIRYYALRRPHPPSFNGHNPLAGIAYVLLYFFFLVEIFTGLALFAWVYGQTPWSSLFGWLYDWIPIQQLRLWHFLLMWGFVAFTVHHIYSAMLIDSEERNGELSSIVTGWKADTEGDGQ